MSMIVLFLYSVVSLKPIYFVAGFGNTAIYSQISNPLIYPECPTNIERFLILDSKSSNNQFITAYPDCVSKLFRLQYNSTSRKVEQLPGIITDSSRIDDSLIYSDIFESIIPLFRKIGYRDNFDLFSVGYNYYFHPISSYSVYNNLKKKIEQVYARTGEKSIFISYDQGTSFTSIFLSNYSQLKWINKYIDSVIFIDPTFAGLSTFPQLLTQTMPPFIPTTEFKKSIMRMPGLLIRMPNYVIFENYTLSNNLTNKIDHYNASHAFEYLKGIEKVDSESELIFKAEIEKFLKVPVPEPPIPSLIIYNDEKSDKIINSLYACANWNSTTCIEINEKVTNSEILKTTKTANSIVSFIVSRSKSETHKSRIILENNIETVKTASFAEASGKFNDEIYLNSHMVESSKFQYSGTVGFTDYPLSNAFDNNPDTYYLPSRENSETFNNTISINFTEKVSLEAFIYNPGFLQGQVQGFPTKTCIYTSIGDEPLSLKVIFEGSANFSDTNIQFIFPQIIECDKLKLEFANTTIQRFYGSSRKPLICNLNFVQHFDFECSGIESASNSIYSNSGYFSSHVIDKKYFSFAASSEGVSNYPLSNAFDEDPLSYYISSEPNSDTFNNTVMITFSEEVLLEAFLLDPCYTDSGSSRKFHGFPTKLCVYSTIGNKPFSFNTIFIGWPIYSWSKIQFVFPQPIKCDKLKLEFVDVTEQTIEGNSKSPIIGELHFMHSYKTVMFEGVNDKFANNSYVDSLMVPRSNFSISGPKEVDGFPLSNAFDGDSSTYYLSSVANSNTLHNVILINFNYNVTLEALVYEPKYDDNGNSRTFHGFPTGLKVYSSIGDNEFSLNNVFYGIPVHPWTRIQFVFTEFVRCDKLKLEFVDLTNQTLNGDSKSLVINELFFIQSFDLEIPIDSICSLRSHCSYEGGNDRNAMVIIKETHFNNIVYSNDGGAIYLINAGISCENTSFNDCQSKNGGGGTIFISNAFNQDHSISLNNVNFNGCKAAYGGAVFIQSFSNYAAVNILYCHFTNCQSTHSQNSQKASDSSGLFTGGSALFLRTKKSSLFECNFFNNVGENQLKIFNDFGTFHHSSLLQSFLKISNNVKYCTFKVNTQSRSSLYYVTGSSGVGTFVKNSFFLGELSSGNYHINGKSFSKFAPKLIVEWCKFSYDSARCFCTDSDIGYIDAVYNKQVFNYNGREGIKQKDIFGYSMIAIAVVVVIIVVILFKKKGDTANAVNEVVASSSLMQDQI